jgi:hypothetical protein
MNTKKLSNEAINPPLRKTVVSGSLFDEWVKNTYPMMYRDKDYAELDYSDIEKFGFWVEKQINSGRFSNCH